MPPTPPPRTAAQAEEDELAALGINKNAAKRLMDALSGKGAVLGNAVCTLGNCIALIWSAFATLPVGQPLVHGQ